MDYSDEVKLSRSPLMRALFFIGGWICVVLGGIGLLLPVVPTTPFLILAAVCFARSSPRFYNWLLNNRWFGHAIRTYHLEKRIPRKYKIIAVVTLVLTLGTTIVFIVPVFAVKILLALIGLAVIIYILRHPS